MAAEDDRELSFDVWQRMAEGDQRALRGRRQEAVEPYRTNGGYALPGLTQNTLAA